MRIPIALVVNGFLEVHGLVVAVAKVFIGIVVVVFHMREYEQKVRRIEVLSHLLLLFFVVGVYASIYDHDPLGSTPPRAGD